MSNERKELEMAENTKSAGVLSAIVTVVGVVGVIVNGLAKISSQNERAEDMRERDKLDRKIIKTKEDKAQMKRLDSKLNGKK